MTTDTKKSPKKRKTNYKPNPKPKAQGETKESTSSFCSLYITHEIHFIRTAVNYFLLADDAVVTMVVGIDFGTTYSGICSL